MRPQTVDELDARIRQAMAAGKWGEVERLQVDLARAEARAPAIPLALGPAALWYAEQGLRVFPLQAGEKIPYPGSRGCLDATSDARQVRKWWMARPESNIGIATGLLVDAIDIDGPLGMRSWLDNEGVFPASLGVVSTPRPGGTHLYIAARGGTNRAGVLPGIDLRASGGYVVAPPSTLAPAAERDYHGSYTWRHPLRLGGAHS